MASKIAFISRISLFILALAMLICSAGLVVWGSFMANRPYDRQLKDVVFNYNSSEPLANDKYNLRAWIWSVYWSIYGLCIAGVVISIIGLIGAISRKKTVIATFLVLIVPYILIQFGGSITIWTKRGTLRRLIYRFANDIYLTNSLFDISIIQNTYECCGVQNGSWTCPNTPPCDTSVFNSVDNTMMIAGLVMIPILFFELCIITLSALILKTEPRVQKVRKTEENQDDAWVSQ
ncbi:CRE-TSP-2 protein [Caenorhabditis remanei]|uniref:CRE-TSP-2 protein n=1 Tax=Caenorhabditis remanei TaxID=31234 RepID=E3LT18_CAERE|nr:CRE-TSP-2 protein [Caenorhabditis remanei]